MTINDQFTLLVTIIYLSFFFLWWLGALQTCTFSKWHSDRWQLTVQRWHQTTLGGGEWSNGGTVMGWEFGIQWDPMTSCLKQLGSRAWKGSLEKHAKYFGKFDSLQWCSEIKYRRRETNTKNLDTEFWSSYFMPNLIYYDIQTGHVQNSPEFFHQDSNGMSMDQNMGIGWHRVQGGRWLPGGYELWNEKPNNWTIGFLYQMVLHFCIVK